MLVLKISHKCQSIMEDLRYYLLIIIIQTYNPKYPHLMIVAHNNKQTSLLQIKQYNQLQIKQNNSLLIRINHLMFLLIALALLQLESLLIQLLQIVHHPQTLRINKFLKIKVNNLTHNLSPLQTIKEVLMRVLVHKIMVLYQINRIKDQVMEI